MLDKFGSTIVEGTGGTWSRGGITVGPCSADEAMTAFNGMAPDSWTPPPQPVMVPASVALWQAKAALSAVGKLDTASALVTAIGGNVALAWEYGNTIDRSSPAMAAMGARMGLSFDDLDKLFIAAAGIAI